MRRQLVRERARVRNRIHQILDAAGVRVGGILSDLSGANGTCILEGLVAGAEREESLASLSHHMRARMHDLCDALSAHILTPPATTIHDNADATRFDRFPDCFVNPGNSSTQQTGQLPWGSHQTKRETTIGHNPSSPLPRRAR